MMVVYGATFLTISKVTQTPPVCFVVYPHSAVLIIFTDTYCLAPIDFSHSDLCCGLIHQKPTHCLNGDTLNTSTCPSQQT